LIWFDDFASSYLSDDKEIDTNIELKRKHSLRVLEIIESIGRGIGLDEHDQDVSKISALLHDVGRFEQYKRYRTFNDRVSVDHGKLGVEILKEKAVLEGIGQEDADLILDSIRNHNRAKLPEGMDKRLEIHSKLLRDADKVDILYVITRYYNGEDGRENPKLIHMLPDTPDVSEGVYEDIVHHRIVDSKNVKNLNDLKMLHMGWVFDINYSPALEMISNRGYLDMIFRSLPQEEKFIDAYELVCGHIKKQKVYI